MSFLAKVNVRCNQTGRVFTCNAEELITEQIQPINNEDIYDGSQLLWEVDGDGYPVTVIEATEGD